MQIRTLAYDLPLKHAFTISRESITSQPTVIVELSDGEHCGYGEATTNSYYGMTLERIRGALDSVEGQLASITSFEPDALWEALAPKLNDCGFAQCALDQAAYDLWGKQQGRPVYELLGLSNSETVASNFTIGIDTVENHGRQAE